MTYVIIIVLVLLGLFIYMGVKGNADMKNVTKYGGLKNKYKVLIDLIMARNPLYTMKVINANNVSLLNTGMQFKLIEMDKKLQISWTWVRFGTDKKHHLVWKFDEFEDQKHMYEIIDRDMAIQNYIDDGMTKNQAIDWYAISKAQNEAVQEELISKFSNKYPELWAQLTN